MRARSSLFVTAAALLAVVFAAPTAATETDRSAAIKQVTSGETLSERSNAGFDQIATISAGRTSAVDQIDPSLEARAVSDSPSDRTSETQDGARTSPCVLTPEQQAIVTSLESQGRLPAGDCEMVAWFGRPGDRVESEDRRSLSEAVFVSSPELLGQEVEADRAARLEEERRQSEAAASEQIASTILTPAMPGPSAN